MDLSYKVGMVYAFWVVGAKLDTMADIVYTT